MASTTIPSQLETIEIVTRVDPQSLFMIAQSFALYAWSRSFAAPKCREFITSLQVVLFDAMRGGTRRFEKAPRIFWSIYNGVTPKGRISYNGLHYSFRFEPDAVIVNLARSNGAIFGLNQTVLNQDGLYVIDIQDMPVYSVEESVSRVQELFNFCAKTLPMIPYIDESINDASIFAFKQAYFVDPPPGPTNSEYASFDLEVPITSWLGYLGLAQNRNYSRPEIAVRIPSYTIWGLGHAGVQVGVRLQDGPNYNVDAGLTFKFVDVETLILTEGFRQLEVADKSLTAGRAISPKGFPRSFGPISDGGEAIDAVSHFLFMMDCIMSKFDSYSCCWFGISNFDDTAVWTGTNRNASNFGINFAMDSVAAELVKSSAPVFNARQNKYSVTVPKISPQAIANYLSILGNYYQTAVQWGNTRLDVLNSMNNGFTVSLNIGYSLEAEFSICQTAENINTGLMPTAIVASGPDIPKIQNAGKCDMLSAIPPVTAQFTQLKSSYENYLARVERKKQTNPNIKKTIDFITGPDQLTSPGNNVFNAVTMTISPPLYGELILAHGGFSKLNSSVAFDAAMCLPYIRMTYKQQPIAPETDLMMRQIFSVPYVLDDTNMIEKPAYWISKTVNGRNFVHDPTTPICSEVANILKNRNDKSQGGAFMSYNPDPLKVLGSVFKVVDVMKTVTQRGRQRRQERKQSKATHRDRKSVV